MNKIWFKNILEYLETCYAKINYNDNCEINIDEVC